MALSFFLLVYAAGLACAPYLEFTRTLTILPWLTALLWFSFRRQRYASLLLAAFFWSLGVLLYHLAITPPQKPGHIRFFLGDQPRTIEATVLTASVRPSERMLIDLEVHRVGDNGIMAPAQGKVRLFLDEAALGLQPGTVVRFRSKLRAPQTFGTPGEYNYPRQLARQRIFVTTSLKNAHEIAILRTKFTKSNSSGIEAWRRKVALGIEQHLPSATAALVKALVIGDKGGVTPQQRDLLARGGVSHIFAISGLHLGLIALFLYSTLLALYRRSETLLLRAPPKRLLPLFILPILLVYLLVTGNALPTRRAFLMTLAGSLLLFGARRIRPMRLLTSVAFLLLLLEPLALFEPSFQLSFAGVFGILLLLPRWQSRTANIPKSIRWTVLSLFTTLAATITTTPLVLLHFHLFAPAGLITNLIAVPAIGFLAVPLALTGSLLLPLWSEVAVLFLQVSGFIVEGVLQLVQWMITLPYLGGQKVYLTSIQIMGVALICALPCVAGCSIVSWSRRGWFLAIAIILFYWTPKTPAALSVTALSVGQADAFLVSLADGRNFLVDGGGPYSTTFDVGERLLAPALTHLGIRSLDAVILTHDQADHRQGLPYLLQQFPVRSFWTSEGLDQIDSSLRDTIRKQNVPAFQFPAGWSILEENTDETMALFVPAIETGNPNNRSLVLYLRQGSDGVLLTGDLESAGVIELLKAPLPGPVTLLKLPHHGSRTSSTELLLDHLRPQLTFVSVGAGNRFRFPHAEVLSSLKQHNIPLYRTDQSGSIRFLSDGNGWRIQQWKRGLFR